MSVACPDGFACGVEGVDPVAFDPAGAFDDALATGGAALGAVSTVRATGTGVSLAAGGGTGAAPSGSTVGAAGQVVT